MQRPGKLPGALLGLAWLAIGLTGCADGILPELRPLSPWARKEWQQDEQFGTTFHRKVSDLAALRSSADALALADREAIAQKLAGDLAAETSAAMRMELVRALGELKTESSNSAIASTLADENPRVRMVACRALGRQPTTENLQSLGKVVSEDNDLDVRIAAARELGNFQDPAAAQALRSALDDRDAALQNVAMQSLRGITGRAEYANSPSAWRQYLDGGNPDPPPAPSIAQTLQQYWYWY
jgi:HEAT repeat protein